MDEDFSPKGLFEEWSLLVHSFLEESSPKLEIVQQLQQLDMNPVKKELSLKRKVLNQSIEKIKIRIEEVNSIIENLVLVGSDTSDLFDELNSLNADGEKISEEILALDNKIRKIHNLQQHVA